MGTTGHCSLRVNSPGHDSGYRYVSSQLYLGVDIIIEGVNPDWKE